MLPELFQFCNVNAIIVNDRPLTFTFIVHACATNNNKKTIHVASIQQALHLCRCNANGFRHFELFNHTQTHTYIHTHMLTHTHPHAHEYNCINFVNRKLMHLSLFFFSLAIVASFVISPCYTCAIIKQYYRVNKWWKCIGFFVVRTCSCCTYPKANTI